MYQLIVLFFEITILRKGPQDVPAAPVVYRLVFVPYIGVNLLILLLDGSWSKAVAQIAVETALLVGFCYPLLYFAGKTARFPQTFTALLGTDAIISLCAIPAVASLQTQIGDFAFIAVMGMMLWHWLVNGHIFRNALDRPFLFGLALAFLYILISSQVMTLLFAGPAAD
ncbi:hypothetical protein [Methylomonas koyamae]|uniref:Uncharacterized protein n=1 Tax=Methylomonas koyamae TaxID=702114 RepID=A0A291IE86_9GAMM|nr:hypothetical protein [Methylomonas koyamae]ATG88664.1 hypothetical protein MKLM6_0385 [Methylomonas koyamae]OAI27564.1 hypothetical protein A1356_09360 [Methylomonas koyamae]WNB76325.1 hypothetical protein RI210_01785 [Methylomonas koyamae]